MQLEVLAWLSVVRCHRLGDFEKIAEAWLSLLFPEGGIARAKASGCAYVVLAASRHGCLLWPADQYQIGAHTGYFPSVATGTKSEWQVALSEDDFECIPCQPMPPKVARLVFAGVAGLPFGVLLSQSGLPQSMWVSAAWHGFVGLTDKYLDKTMKRFSMLDGIAPQSRPKGVLAKLEILVRFFIPDIGTNDLSWILKKRAAGSTRVRTSLLMKGENLEHTFGAMDDEDAKAAKGYHETHTAKLSKRAQTLQWLKERKLLTEPEFLAEMRDLGLDECAGAPKRKSKANPKAEPAPSLKTAWSWTEVFLKSRVPPGCHATMQDVVDANRSCWVARYPNAKGQHASCTRSYRNGLRSSSQAARIAFKWLWDTHESHTGERCPHTLPSDLS